MTDEQLLKRTAHKLLRGSWSHQVEDLLQEGRIALWRLADKAPEDPARSASFKVQVAKAAMIDYMRSQTWGKRAGCKDTTGVKAIHYVDPETLDHELSYPDNAATLLEDEDFYRALMSSCRKAGPVAQDVALHTLNGLTVNEISKLVGVKPYAVRNILAKIIRRM